MGARWSRPVQGSSVSRSVTGGPGSAGAAGTADAGQAAPLGRKHGDRHMTAFVAVLLEGQPDGTVTVVGDQVKVPPSADVTEVDEADLSGFRVVEPVEHPVAAMV
jgi:hypothetical protein